MNIVVGVSDMKTSQNPGDCLVTYSLGSCIGIAVYDPFVKVGGLLHYMLPESAIGTEQNKPKPYMFADTGIPLLFKAVYALGGLKRRMRVVMVGGSQLLDEKGFFNIGKRNEMAARKIFHRNNVVIDFSDTGGQVNRTLRLDIDSGDMRLKISGQGEVLI